MGTVTAGMCERDSYVLTIRLGGVFRMQWAVRGELWPQRGEGRV